MNALVFVKSTNSHEKVIKLFMILKERLSYMTLHKLQMRNGENLEEQLTSFAEASPAKPSQLQENEKASLMKLVEHYSLKSQEPLKKSNHHCFSLKTSKAYYLTTEGELLEQSSPRLMNWGTMQSGSYLTQRILESRKTENVCTLSDILEENVPDQYFLSEEKTEQLIKQISSKSGI